jgi:hypothetical protein
VNLLERAGLIIGAPELLNLDKKSFPVGLTVSYLSY